MKCSDLIDSHQSFYSVLTAWLTHLMKVQEYPWCAIHSMTCFVGRTDQAQKSNFLFRPIGKQIAQPCIESTAGNSERPAHCFRAEFFPVCLYKGDITIRSSHVTFGDIYIFKQWNLTDAPTILIGMGVLGLLDTLVIDCKRKELQVRVRTRN